MTAYLAHFLVMVGIYAILALSLNLLIGYSGIFSLAHAAIYGIGAYASALAALKLGLGFWEGWSSPRASARSLRLWSRSVAARRGRLLRGGLLRPAGRAACRVHELDGSDQRPRRIARNSPAEPVRLGHRPAARVRVSSRPRSPC